MHTPLEPLSKRMRGQMLKERVLKFLNHLEERVVGSKGEFKNSCFGEPVKIRSRVSCFHLSI
jgi:hypothetical protein